MISAAAGCVTLAPTSSYCLALNENFAGGDDASGFDVEQARSVEDDRVRGGRGLRLGGLCVERHTTDEDENETKDGALREGLPVHRLGAIINYSALSSQNFSRGSTLLKP